MDAYKIWIEQEGIPVIRDWYIEDLRTVPLSPWVRTGGLGAYVDLVGSADRQGAYICEIPPGGSLKPEKHLFEEFIYIVSGEGTASVWNEGGAKQTFAWQAGSLFSPPLNTWHAFSNTQSHEPARFFAVTGAPMYMNLFHNEDFIFHNAFAFEDRYAGENNYFSGEGKLMEIVNGGEFSRAKVWETNFIRDVQRKEVVQSPEQFGAAFATLELSQNTMEAHILELAVGTYKNTHRHTGGAHVIGVSGKGYSLLWPEGGQMQRYDWHEGSVVVPPEGWWHNHFNTGTKPARQLALRWEGRKYRYDRQWRRLLDVKKGGDMIDHADEDPEIRRLFREELAKNGAPWGMSKIFPNG